MLRLLLMSVLIVASYALVAKLPTSVCRETSPVDTFKLNEVAKTWGLRTVKSYEPDVTESLAQQALAGEYVADSRQLLVDDSKKKELSPLPSGTGKMVKRALAATADDGQAVVARKALKSATGSIIAFPTFIPCPKLTSSWSPQELCPSRRDILKTFYSGGKCYVLFPYWQKKYYTRCLCRECRTDCISKYRRNQCTPERYSFTYVWAFCRSRQGFKIRNVRVRLGQGKCECKSYRRKC